jgi:hypothetical protein
VILQHQPSITNNPQYGRGKEKQEINLKMVNPIFEYVDAAAGTGKTA